MSKSASACPNDAILLALDADSRKAAESAIRMGEELKAVTLA